ncbi:MAG: Holliday junction branch migration protein RuvA [Candidatus Atribacteria bacterium]|nr:Holliday junction branch migration protein RuvA [Candidatus Atribacteria bacterium]
MIFFLQGKIESVGVSHLVMDVNNVGYYIHIPTYVNFSLKIGEIVKIYTHLYLREDKIMLFGFLTRKEKIFFELLISTPGVGPKVGLKVLSKMTPDNFNQAILREDIDSITAIGGIGNKLAKKIILELKEKIKKSTLKEVGEVRVFKSKDMQDAIDALKTLGYTNKKAILAINKTQEKFKEKLTVEELIRESLKIV